MRAAMADAGVSDLDYLHAHATGTQQGDAAELQAAEQICDGLARLPMSSHKGAIGHLLHISGVAAIAATATALRTGTVPPTVGLSAPKPAAGSSFRHHHLARRRERGVRRGRAGTGAVLVANAGITRDAPVTLMTEEQFGQVIDTNLASSTCVRRAVPAMRRGRWGRIVLIGSEVGQSGNAGQVNYAASKAGLVGMARSLARELGARGITVNTVAPGLIETDMTADLADRHKKALVAASPVPRTGTAEEVASAVAWLASENTGYVTGAVIPVDGGMGMGA
ncbi:hypothetical protein SSPIM334S_00847 [Streptomyces spiroverticillatus]